MEISLLPYLRLLQSLPCTVCNEGFIIFITLSPSRLHHHNRIIMMTAQWWPCSNGSMQGGWRVTDSQLGSSMITHRPGMQIRSPVVCDQPHCHQNRHHFHHYQSSSFSWSSLWPSILLLIYQSTEMQSKIGEVLACFHFVANIQVPGREQRSKY